jgi:hypothetical protein
VGFESVFPPAWENEDFDLEGEKVYHEQQIRDLVTQVTEETADDWLLTIRRCARTESNDLATYPSFGSFLEQIGRAKPQIMLQYLKRLDGPLVNFLPAMLRGLSKSARSEDAHRMVEQWVRDGIHLRQIAWYLRFVEDFDAKLLEDTLYVALEDDDDTALLGALETALARYKDHPSGVIDTVFMPVLTYFTARKDTRWINVVPHYQNRESPFRCLPAEQADAVLAGLVFQTRIDYRSERILAVLAETWPEKVFDYFGSRLRLAETEESINKYEPIPFRFRDLRQPFSRIPDYIIATTRAWYQKNHRLFPYRGGRLVAIIFPEYHQDLHSRMVSLIRSDDREDVEFILKILNNYEGETFLHEILKEIIEALSSDDVLLDVIAGVLNSTGVVAGEFGFVEAYRRKKSELELWLTDPREKIRLFAERQLRSLDHQIAAEQRSSEEELELRKRNYGGQDGGKDQ